MIDTSSSDVQNSSSGWLQHGIVLLRRLFDPPPDKRSAGKRQSRATPIPASYVYSPSLVPRPRDWPDHVQVVQLVMIQHAHHIVLD